MTFIRLLILLVLGWGVALGLMSIRPELPPPPKAKPIGNATIGTLTSLMEKQLQHLSGWLPNDTPLGPGSWLDNAANEQLGLLSVLRSVLRAVRDQASRSQNALNREVDLAYSSWSVDPRRWNSPAPEILYLRGIDALNRYRDMLRNGQAQFNTTPDSINAMLQAISTSLSQQVSLLSADQEIFTTQRDDLFYQSRGTALASHLLLQALLADFQSFFSELSDQSSTEQVLNLLQQALKSLQRADFRPLIITQGRGPSLTADHIQRIRQPLRQSLEYLRKASLIVEDL